MSKVCRLKTIIVYTVLEDLDAIVSSWQSTLLVNIPEFTKQYPRVEHRRVALSHLWWDAGSESHLSEKHRVTLPILSLFFNSIFT